MSKEIKRYSRRSVFAELPQFDYLAEEHDHIEVTEWGNGDGFDVAIGGIMSERVSLTWGMYKALKALVKELKKHDE